MVILLTSTYALEEDKIKFQGKIMDLNLGKNMMIVNERLFILDDNTIIKNVEGSLITIEKIKMNSWAYIEAERDKTKNQMVIKKINLLPKHIDNKERNRYPFMQ